jgi:hypothetical protein
MLGLVGLRLYGAIAAALALAVMLGTLKVQHGTIGKLRTEVGTVTAQREQAMSANLNEAAALDQCLESNAQWMSLGKGVAQIAANLKELDQAKAQRDIANAQLKEVRKHVTPQCQALQVTDFESICAPVAASLRQRAENH